MRKRVILKSPVHGKRLAGICERGTGQPVSLSRQQGALTEKLCEVGGESPPGLAAKPPGFRTKELDGKV